MSLSRLEAGSPKSHRQLQGFLLDRPDARLYLFVYGSSIYPTAIALVEGRIWLVILGLDGVLETAFSPNNSDSYLADESFIYLGLLDDLEA